MNNLDNYSRKNVILLGGAGFIGSNLAKALVSLNSEVVIINKNVNEKKRELADFIGQQTFILKEGDLNEPESYEDLLKKTDIVINLAGISGSLNSLKNPVDSLRINCEGHLLFLESCKRMNRKLKVVFASSRLVYGETGRSGAKEDSKVDPKDIYAIHKLTAEYYYRLYSNIHSNIESTIVRMTNPFGPAPRHCSSKVGYNFINNTIHKVLMDEEITVYGDGKQLRDYIYIDDLVEAVLRIAAVDAPKGGIFNIGSGNSISIMDAILQVFFASGKENKIRNVEWPPDSLQVETGDFKADITKIKETCNWHPKFSYQEGLRETIEFLKHQYNLSE